MKTLNKHCVLLSGGLDSYYMLLEVVEKFGRSLVEVAIFDYGQNHLEEVEVAKKIAKFVGVNFTVINLPKISKEGDIYILRNSMLLISAVSKNIKLGCKYYYIGCCKEDQSAFPDCREVFIQNLNTTLLSSGYDVEVVAPLISKSKVDIFKELRKNKEQFDFAINNTLTCYNGVTNQNDWGKGCGGCSSCSTRKSSYEESLND